MKNAMQRWLKYAESNRREKNGQFSTAPVTGVVDYGESLGVLTLAVSHLTEGLPNGQLERALAAHRAAELAVVELGMWLGTAAKGGVR